MIRGKAAACLILSAGSVRGIKLSALNGRGGYN
jgi:hypothetical protein